MIASYFPSQPYSKCPESPYVKIGELTHHYSTGTMYEHVYSDDPKTDIPGLLKNGMFSLGDKFKPRMLRNGVVCKIKPFQTTRDNQMVYLMTPVDDPNISIGERRIILNPDDVTALTLEQLQSY